ncbi:hypothetical protein [Halomonas mongoliensis]
MPRYSDERLQAVLQLSSPENTFTTGQTPVIDGGATSMIGD